jgi:dihydroflavonol-4-reductase
MSGWIVTGAGGRLGHLVVRALEQRGRSVQAWVRTRRDALSGLACEIISVDIRDSEAVRRAIDASIEGVVHAAARISLEGRHGPELIATNLRGTEHVVAACRAAGARLIHVSSIHAFDPSPRGAAVDEDRPLATAPRHFVYDRSKALGEAAVRAATDVETLVLNPTAMIGPDDPGPTEMGRFVDRLLRRRLPGLVAADFDWVDARDVAALIARLAVEGPRGGRYILSGERRSLPEIARTICAAAGVEPPRVISPLWLAQLTAPVALGWARLSGAPPLYTPASLATLRAYRKVDGSRARRELGWAPRPLDQTLRETVAWWQARR